MATLRGQIPELLLLPALACLSPWPVFYRLARQLSRVRCLHGESTAQALQAAQKAGLVDDPALWQRQFRLNKLIDSVDPWLSLLRSDRWQARQLDVQGNWPTQGPFVAASLHWGTGMAALKHIRDQAGPVSMVLRPVQEWGESFSPPMRFYLEAYEREIARAGGAPITTTGPGLTRRLHELVNTGKNLLVLLDVPKGSNRNALPVDFLGQPTFFANGVINLALQAGLPIVPYSIGLDFRSGRRRLEILPPLTATELAPVMQQLATYFDLVVKRQSAGWHFWPLHQALLTPDFSGT